MAQQSVFIYGPAGCGKTTNAEKLRGYFKLDRVVDEFYLEGKRHSQRINLEGDLILSGSKSNLPEGVRFFSYDAACAMAQLPQKVRP